MEYDENAAIEYIRTKLPDEIKNVSDDEILNVIDIIWDYYDEHGLLDIDLADDDDDELDLDDLIKYVTKMVVKDKKSPFSADQVPDIVKAELEYEDSIEE